MSVSKTFFAYHWERMLIELVCELTKLTSMVADTKHSKRLPSNVCLFGRGFTPCLLFQNPLFNLYQDKPRVQHAAKWGIPLLKSLSLNYYKFILDACAKRKAENSCFILCSVFQGWISPYKFLVPCLSLRVKFTNQQINEKSFRDKHAFVCYLLLSI